MLPNTLLSASPAGSRLCPDDPVLSFVVFPHLFPFCPRPSVLGPPWEHREDSNPSRWHQSSNSAGSGSESGLPRPPQTQFLRLLPPTAHGLSQSQTHRPLRNVGRLSFPSALSGNIISQSPTPSFIQAPSNSTLKICFQKRVKSFTCTLEAIKKAKV